MNAQTQWLMALFILNLALAPATQASIPSYDKGRMGGSSMGGQFAFEGAFFSKKAVADKPMASQATRRIVKFAFRSKLGWYAIAYYPENKPKAGMKEYGRFTVASADKKSNSYVITLYDPDYKGEYIANVPNPPKPNDLSGKKQVATIELKVQDKELAVSVKNAESDQVSLAKGDAFQMAVKEE